MRAHLRLTSAHRSRPVTRRWFRTARYVASARTPNHPGASRCRMPQCARSSSRCVTDPACAHRYIRAASRASAGARAKRDSVPERRERARRVPPAAGCRSSRPAGSSADSRQYAPPGHRRGLPSSEPASPAAAQAAASGSWVSGACGSSPSRKPISAGSAGGQRPAPQEARPSGRCRRDGLDRAPGPVARPARPAAGFGRFAAARRAAAGRIVRSPWRSRVRRLGISAGMSRTRHSRSSASARHGPPAGSTAGRRPAPAVS